GGGSQELVNVSGNEYRAKVQGDFTKYIFDGAIWTAYDRAGNTYYFGLNTLLEDDSVEQKAAGKVFRWRLSEVKDINGNYYYIRHFTRESSLDAFKVCYSGEPGTDRDDISSSTHKFHLYIKGEYEGNPRPDAVSLNSAGFTQNQTRRVRDILISTNAVDHWQVTRKYDFEYTTSRRTGRSLMTKVTQRDRDQSGGLPPVTLTYNDDPGAGYSLLSITGDPLAGDNMWSTSVDCNYDHGHDVYGPCSPLDMCYGVNWSQPIVSMDGSACGGAVNWKQNGRGNFWMDDAPSKKAVLFSTYVYVKKAVSLNDFLLSHDSPHGIYINGDYSQNLNEPGAVWNFIPGYNLIEFTDYHQHQNYAFNLNLYLADYVDLMNSTQVIQPQYAADFNGDGLTDAATVFADANTGNVKVALNNGTNFFPKQIWSAGAEQYFRSNNRIILGDFNGDGKVDFSSIDPSANNQVVTLLSNGAKLDSGQIWASGWGPATGDIRTGDFNADRQTDLYAVYPGSLRAGRLVVKIALNRNQAFEVNNAASAVEYDLGVNTKLLMLLTGDFNGDGLTDFATFDKENGAWKIYINQGDLSQGFSLAQAETFGAGEMPVAADFNGDGITDIGYFEHGSGRIYYKTLGPNGFSDMKQFTFNFNLVGSDVQVQTADFNGDGLMDYYVYNSIGQQQIAYAGGGMADLLTKFDNGYGAVTEMTYIPSTQKSNTYLPYSMPLLSRVKVSDGRGNSYVTDYDYAQGLWSAADQEFMGFGKVTVKDADGNWAETTFDQTDIYRRGLPLTSAFYSSDGSLFNKTVNTWSTQTVYNTAPAVKFVKLDRADNFGYDGNATGKRTAAENYYDESPQYGNVTKSVNLGEVDLATGNDIGNDTIISETQYQNKTTSTYQLLGLPKYTRVKDGNNTVLAQSWLYYDGSADFNAEIQIGRLTKTKNWAGDNAAAPETALEYDAYGNVVKTTSPSGKTTTVIYDADWHLFPLETKNALGQTTATAYYGINGVAADNGLWGQAKSVTDANGQSDLSIYDKFGRKTQYISPADTLAKPTSVASVDYFGNYSRVTNYQRVISGEDAVIKTVEFYDGFGRLIQAKTPTDTPNQFRVSGQTQYDQRGLPQYAYLPFLSTASQDEIDPIATTSPRTKTDYDPAGRPIKTLSPDGTYANVLYDDWTTTTIDPNGHKQESVSDSRGNLIEKREYAGADGRAAAYPAQSYTLYATTKYDYDLMGHLIKTTDAKGNQVSITYDPLGRKTGMNDPDMGTWQYVYDLEGNLISQTDAKGQTLEFTYDALNRLLNKTDHDKINVTYTYDDPNAAFATGRLTQVEYPGGNTKFTYDNLGRELTSTKTIDGQSYTVRRTYDDLGNIRDLTYPSGEKIYYRYNAAGQPDGVASDPALLQKSEVRQTKTLELAFGVIPAKIATVIPAKAGIPGVNPAKSGIHGVTHLLETLLGVSYAEAAAIPFTPTISSVTGGVNQITINWSAIAGADSYVVYWGPTSGVYPNSRDVGNVTTFTVNPLDAGTAYFFRVSAKNAAGESIQSDQKWTATIPAPTAINSLQGGTNQITLYYNWVKNISGYNIYYGTQPGVYGQPKRASGSAYDLTGLDSGTKYYLSVTTLNASGESAKSPEKTAVTLVDAPILNDPSVNKEKVTLTWTAAPGADSYKIYYGTSPGKYTKSVVLGKVTTTTLSLAYATKYYFAAAAVNVSGESAKSNEKIALTLPGYPAINVSGGDKQIQVAWTAVPGADSYILYYRKNSETNLTAVPVANVTSYKLQNLPSGTQYFFRVSAVNAAGEGTQSDEKWTCTLADATILRWARGAQGQITVNIVWVQSATSYNLYYRKEGDAKILSKKADSTTYTITGLENGTRYYLAVTTVDPGGESPKSPEISALTFPGYPAINVTGGDKQIQVAWTAVSGADTYRVYYGTTSGFYTDVVAEDHATRHIVKPLPSGTQYFFRVSAVNASGEGYQSDQKWTMTIPDATGIRWARGGKKQITVNLNWVQAAAVYRVYYGTQPGVYDGSVDADSTTYTVPNLKDGTKYYLAATSVDPGGESVKSAETIASTIIGAPVLNQAWPADQQVKLSWTAVSGATGYKVKYGTTTGNYSTTIDVGDVTKTNLPNLTNGTIYYIAVSAYDAQNESAVSNEAVVKPYTAAAVVYVKSVSYDVNGQTTRIEYGNGDVTTRTFDPLNLRLTRVLTVNQANQTLQDLNYTYDAIGDILSIVDKVNTASQTFKYDHLNRLVTATGSYGNKTYTYDEIGNIQTMDGRSYTYGENYAGAHAVTSLSDNSKFTYDANGNMATRQVTGGDLQTLTYDAENRLTGISKNNTAQETFTYDGDGGRTKVSAGGMLTKYIGSLYEEDNFGKANHIFLGSSRIATVRNGSQLFYHTDHLGGTNVTTDNAGTVKEKFEYEPYGKTARHDAAALPEETTKYNFTGKESDATSGLYYFEARYYDSSLGRFITPDKIVQEISNPQTINRYTYANNNPVNNIDPTGHSWFKKWFSKAVAFVAAAVTFVATMGNPGAAAAVFMAFNVTDTVVGGIQALAYGANPGMVLGSIGFSIGIGMMIPEISSSNLFLQVVGNAIRGAGISVATTAAMSGGRGNLGEAAAWGGGAGGVSGFITS
ncbi:MAG: fibronectin type III domain-containing protein, partial [Candidatus Omnitrophica bacterium]|nr:fibronectin type III domain-containing protein [Candidatus Omnitrophota bacterium]